MSRRAPAGWRGRLSRRLDGRLRGRHQLRLRGPRATSSGRHGGPRQTLLADPVPVRRTTPDAGAGLRPRFCDPSPVPVSRRASCAGPRRPVPSPVAARRVAGGSGSFSVAVSGLCRGVAPVQPPVILCSNSASRSGERRRPTLQKEHLGLGHRLVRAGLRGRGCRRPRPASAGLLIPHQPVSSVKLMRSSISRFMESPRCPSAARRAAALSRCSIAATITRCSLAHWAVL